MLAGATGAANENSRRSKKQVKGSRQRRREAERRTAMPRETHHSRGHGQQVEAQGASSTEDSSNSKQQASQRTSETTNSHTDTHNPSENN